MGRLLGIVVTIGAICISVPAALYAFQIGDSDENFAVSGSVYYEDGQRPAVNVTVELRDPEEGVRAQQITTVTGGFEFRGLRRADFSISIRVVGYARMSLPVDLSGGSIRGLAIYLQRVDGGQPAGNAKIISAHELGMPPKSRELLESGKKKLYIDKDAQGGLQDLQQAVSESPDCYEAYYYIAMAYLTLGKREDAQQNFRKSIETSGDKYGEAEIGLGTMLLDQGKTAESEKAIRRGLELSPNSWMGNYELGRALLNQNLIPEAKKCAEQARSLSPNAAVVYRLLANIHLREKNYPAMLADIDAYIKLDPDSPAGLRAKQMRAEVAQKISQEETASAGGSRP